MKNSAFFIFFSTFLIVYTLANYYVLNRGWQVLSYLNFPKYIYLTLSIVLYLSFLISHILFRNKPIISDFFHIIGSFWLIFLLYFFISILILDIIRIFNLLLKFLPAKNSLSYVKLKNFTFYTIITIVSSIIIYGYFNAKNIIFKELTLYTEKKFTNKSQYKFIFLSDLHYNDILYGEKFLKKLVNRINNENPDFIVLGGDIIDEFTLNKKNLYNNSLKYLKSLYGVYVITGNHEYIGSLAKSKNYFDSIGFKLLIDEVITIGDLILIGRNDFFSLRFENIKKRKPLKVIINENKIDRSKFIIVADHQPLKIEEAIENNIDLQLSGHTHYGQFWPFNLIVKKTYLIPWGYKKINNTHFYISSGVGTWGPPVRNMSKSEIVIIKIINK